MIKIYRGSADALKRTDDDVERDGKIRESVSEIIADVRARGDAALYDYALKFDKAELSAIEVSAEEIERAVSECDEKLTAVMKRAAENIRAFHSRQVREPFVIKDKPGVVMGQKITPIEKVG
ncbi:MAG: histidinol dehydrogenase, partial [Clostridia bacterium]|nr:histidinol dehydrogenase [Clostridia bacterium]